MSISCTDSSTDLDDQDRERNHLSHKIWDLVASVIKGLNQEKPNSFKVLSLVQPQPSAFYGSCSTTSFQQYLRSRTKWS
ncbi:hypothetical protein C1H46_028477 [Malus baccata]|uniref:Uncharacterized protein n=1 Tax=Malus baccata TaxID=106549 RepID=A0A540LHJ0_MALBA|nr:hypothetical protein C1H46_028477 [Malus baccata]